ncbi:hypothetical protein GH714_000167 [Hevea brasiliensis]|uniref:Stress-response A/B barrel domain-containing protein n=1 Tax=Hevea brasiliensis TaxID=3981 RepID=A0A6A6LAN2_HEVBR|nr:hypothetical protein GH714_000167 [Hevea brasiliensis]
MIPRRVISSISSLQVLKMYHAGIFADKTREDSVLWEDNMLTEELQCLEHLNELSSTIRGVSNLQSFISTRTSLNCTRVIRLELFTGPQSLNIWWLLNMKNLDFLDIIGEDNPEGLGVDVVMEEIETHDAAGGLGNSMSSRETCFNSLHTLTLTKNLRLRDLTWLILAPNLKKLQVTFNKHIEEIISVEKLDDAQARDENFNPFLKLQYLTLVDLPELKSIYPKALSFPFLEKIILCDCPQLKKLPLNSSSANGGKVEIEAGEQWWKDIEWEDDSTKTTFQPCDVPYLDRYWSLKLANYGVVLCGQMLHLALDGVLDCNPCALPIAACVAFCFDFILRCFIQVLCRKTMDEAKEVVKHILLAKFKGGIPSDQNEKIIKGYANFAIYLIEPMKAFHWGTNVSIENLHQGFTHVFESTFESTEGVAEYVSHPAHVEFANLFLAAVEKVIVIDYKPTAVRL